MTLNLDGRDTSLLNGEAGDATAVAMRILTAFSAAIGAEALLDVSRAHIDGCLYHGQVSLDFVERLVSGGGRVRVPTTLNVGSLDLIHPELTHMSTADQLAPRRLMKAHQELGCMPTFTCAPYQTRFRPKFGEQIAWGESNAIVFANSVIGARTNRYGDFIDLCCALTGRAPAWGLHLDQNRLGEVLFQLEGFPDAPPDDSLYVAVGLLVGSRTGERVPVIEGLPAPRDEDQLKALGAAAASAGSVGLFHAVEITPEARTIEEAFGGSLPKETIVISPSDVASAIRHLSTVPEGTRISAVCLGTPHFSREEWDRLLSIMKQIAPRSGIPIYVNTGRETLLGLVHDKLFDGMDGFNLIPVADTCTYINASLKRLEGVVMTNSGKWAHYAPGQIGVQVAFGEMEDCIVSAAAGRVIRRTP